MYLLGFSFDPRTVAWGMLVSATWDKADRDGENMEMLYLAMAASSKEYVGDLFAWSQAWENAFRHDSMVKHRRVVAVGDHRAQGWVAIAPSTTRMTVDLKETT